MTQSTFSKNLNKLGRKVERVFNELTDFGLVSNSYELGNDQDRV